MSLPVKAGATGTKRMNPDELARWERLLEWLEPIHDRARLTARRLARVRQEGDDLFQEALLRAHDKLEALRDPDRFPAWFHAILLSVHRNRSRRGFWRRLAGLDAIALESRPDPAARPADAQYERAESLARALATLPAVQREAIVLHDIDGYALAEIAAMQRAGLSAVKTRIARGRARLRGHYARGGSRRPERGDLPAAPAEDPTHG